MKALFVGLGSIGQRHLRNWCRIEGGQSEVIVFRATQHQNLIEDGRAFKCTDIAEHYGARQVSNLSDALVLEPVVGFVCNPSSLHARTAIALATAKIPFFVEKPVATNLSEADELHLAVSTENVVSMVGYQSRFNPCVTAADAFIKGGELGPVVSAQFNWSTYLPAAHPYENFRDSYAARSELGGGVTHSLSHELDLIQFFFGPPSSVYAMEGGESRLGMSAEDTVMAVFRCRGVAGEFPVSLHLSFAQGLERRSFTVLMEDACLECNLQENLIQVISHAGAELHRMSYEGIERNDLFLREIEHFRSHAVAGTETDIPVLEGMKSLSMAMAVRRAMVTGMPEEIR